ncbi:hypothetical protein B0J14DRAFT_689155 [Halenospora varia]|nr:hypothetical protein B0J14DRAFT_689155 [Halenospora varia]
MTVSEDASGKTKPIQHYVPARPSSTTPRSGQAPQEYIPTGYDHEKESLRQKKRRYFVENGFGDWFESEGPAYKLVEEVDSLSLNPIYQIKALAKSAEWFTDDGFTAKWIPGESKWSNPNSKKRATPQIPSSNVGSHMHHYSICAECKHATRTDLCRCEELTTSKFYEYTPGLYSFGFRYGSTSPAIPGCEIRTHGGRPVVTIKPADDFDRLIGSKRVIIASTPLDNTQMGI